MNADTTFASIDRSAMDGVAAAANALQGAGAQADALAQHGADSLRHGSQAVQRGAQQLQASAQLLTQQAAAYVNRRPFQAVLLAAAAGAALMGLVTLLGRGRDGPHLTGPHGQARTDRPARAAAWAVAPP
jgi:ElaB/YqjD/DUF883 family membrane-anchored ribosome-binding protein